MYGDVLSCSFVDHVADNSGWSVRLLLSDVSERFIQKSTDIFSQIDAKVAENFVFQTLGAAAS